MICLENLYTNDHDSSAGYSGRIGYRYKTVATIKLPAKAWKDAKKHGLGGLVVDVANLLYKSVGFTQTYRPSVDTKARAKKGFVTVSFEYFHNSDADVLKTEYTGYMLKHHQKYNGKADQYSLDPNNN